MDNIENLDVQQHISDNQCTVNLCGEGIDVRDLRTERDVMFEVDPDSIGTTEDEMKVYFDNEEKFKQLNFECLDIGDDEDTTPFDRMSNEMEDITPNQDGGILKVVLVPGAGAVVPSSALCRVHYNAYLEYNDEPFDSSRLRNRQKQFKLGVGEVIPGWEFGVATMKRGETARFLIAPSYGYGELGCPPRIPANAYTLHEIELISFVDQDAQDTFENFSEEERRELPFSQLLKVVDSLRLTGNEAFKIFQFARAAAKYSNALRLVENAHLADERDESKMKEISLTLCLNLSACYIKQAKSGRACQYARKALTFDKKNVKALYRLARASRSLGEYREARIHITKAHNLDPKNTAVREELETLDKEVARSREKDEKMCKKMLNLDRSEKQLEEKMLKQSTTTRPKQPSQMVKMLKERLKKYKRDENQMEDIPLPASLTPAEIEVIEECVGELNLHMYSCYQGTTKSYRVTKNPTRNG